MLFTEQVATYNNKSFGNIKLDYFCRDLLSKEHLTKRLELRERPDTGVYVKDLTSFVCKSRSEIEHVMNVGNVNR